MTWREQLRVVRYCLAAAYVFAFIAVMAPFVAVIGTAYVLGMAAKEGWRRLRRARSRENY